MRPIVQWTGVGAALLLQGACAAVLGFEDHEPYPTTATSTTGSGGGGGSTTTATGTGGSSGGAGGAGGAAGVDVLLIPDLGEDSVGMYSPEDGTYLGDFIPPGTGTEPYDLESPNCAAQGPDGRIYVSDQVADAIVRFEPDGTFESIFADATDGLDNVRGIDFRDAELFASVSPSTQPFVARFDLEGNRLADFVADSSNPFDLLFLPNRTMLLADIEEPDNVRLYDVDATSYAELFSINFPQQIQPLPNGNFVVAGWSEAHEFEIDGTIVRTITDLDSSSGIYPLDNGQWLLSSDAGVQAINPFSQEVIQTARVGTSFMKIERVTLTELPPSAR